MTTAPDSTTGPDGWVPEFEGQRPPFQPGNPYVAKQGNTLALKHGADSPARLNPVAEALVLELLADDATAYLHAPRYSAAVKAWANAEAKCMLISAWVDGQPIEQAASSKQGQTSPLELLRKWEATAQTHRSRLGLDPMSAARLGKDIAQTKQADVAAEMTKLREQHDRAIRGEMVGGDND